MNDSIETFCIALDIGGSSIKSAIVSDAGFLLDDAKVEHPIDSKGSADSIIQTFVELINMLFDVAHQQKINIAGIGMGMPGPFDYENGISLIKNLDKYESIYGLNIKKEFRKHLKLGSKFPIVLENDGWAFTRGETWCGAARGFHRVIGLTLGTGLGSGFYIEDDLVDSGPGVPPMGWFSGLPYEGGIIDDHVSKRSIMRRYHMLKKDDQTKISVKEIARRAKTGDQIAQKVFFDVGFLLGRLLRPTVLHFKPECVVIGGKMALSYDLFAPKLMDELQNIDFLKKILRAQHIEYGGVLGAARLLFKNLS